MCVNEINDERLVCNKCCETMNTVYKFRQMCLRSKTKLTNYFAQLPTVSVLYGAPNVHLTDIKQENLIEDNIETKTEQIFLYTDIAKDYKEIENCEFNPDSCKFTDNRPINIKMENEDQNSEKYIEEATDNSLESQDSKLMLNEIKKESEHLLTSFDNKSQSCASENEDMEYLDKYDEDPLMHRGEIKIDIVDHDIELFDNDTNGEINMQFENKNYEKFAKENHINATTLDINSCYKTTEEKPVSENLKICIEEKSFECSVCKKKFGTLGNLTTHTIFHTEKKSYECNVCKREFNQSYNLKRHMKIHTGEKPYECIVCKKKCRQAGQLKIHMRIHTQEKPCECNLCNKKFRQASDLKIHMRIHAGETYECSVCKKKICQPQNFKRHMRIHSEEKPHECSVCKRKFKQPGDFKMHMRIHTGEKPYECAVCEKKFKQGGDLKIHMRIHTGEKPYECSVCQKKFRQTNQIKIHMRIHTGEKPYECNVCAKKFRRLHTLTNHLRIHTG